MPTAQSQASTTTICPCCRETQISPQAVYCPSCLSLSEEEWERKYFAPQMENLAREFAARNSKALARLAK